MQSNDFMTDKVVAWSNILGNLGGCEISVLNLILYPQLLVVGILADLVNLEPLGARLVELVARNGPTRSHISKHGSDVVRPQSITGRRPVKFDGITRICSGD